MNNKKNILDIFKDEVTDCPEFYDSLNVIYYSGLCKEKFSLYGSGLSEKNSYFRFNENQLNTIKSVNENVRYLAENSAGIKLFFETDSRVIKIKVSENTDWFIHNMTFFAQVGFDLYFYDEIEKKRVFHNVSIPSYYDRFTYSSTIGTFATKEHRKILIHFPLYAAVKNLEIGIEKGCDCFPLTYKNEAKILCYGTSILQGGAVSRPGLSITNILSRELNIDVLNFGFSGNAMLEKEVAEILSSIPDIKALIIDAEANAGYDETILDNLENFINVFLEINPSLNIIIMSKNYMALDQKLKKYSRSAGFYSKFMRKIVSKYRKLKYKVFYINNYSLFKDKLLDKSEFTVDGCHPNDLGMIFLTKNYLKAINKIIGVN